MHVVIIRSVNGRSRTTWGQNTEDERVLNVNLLKAFEWGYANRIDFKVRKDQCCLLAHKRVAVAASVVMDGTNMKRTEALGVLSMRIQCNILPLLNCCYSFCSWRADYSVRNQDSFSQHCYFCYLY